MIELLVVISIIGLLASVIFAVVVNAKAKANDAVIQQELTQMRNLYESVYSTTNGYAALQPKPPYINNNWQKCIQYQTSSSGYVCQMSTAQQCSLVFTQDTPNNIDALNLCNQIIKNSGFFEIAVLSDTNLIQHYSMIAKLASTNKYICMGDSKNTSTFISATNPSNDSINVEMGAGCPGNP